MGFLGLFVPPAFSPPTERSLLADELSWSAVLGGMETTERVYPFRSRFFSAPCRNVIGIGLGIDELPLFR